MEGLKFSNKDMHEEALDIYVKKNIFFTDAFNCAFVPKKGIKEIYSYDEDFDKIKGIKRITP